MTMNRDSESPKRDDPRSTKELVRLALTEIDDDAAWEPVKVLHFRGSEEVLETARDLCRSVEVRERKLGVDILGQLGVPTRSFPDECFHILTVTLGNEIEPLVLEAIGVACGHLRDPRAPDLLAPLSHHSSADVRFGVVSGVSGLETERAIALLVELSSDEDDDVRDWATFGLGSMIDADTPEIRAALLARVVDSNDDARGEALVGLARRKDSRVIEPLINELSSDSVGLLALEAAEEASDPRLQPYLLSLKDAWSGDQDRLTGRLEHALQSCSGA
jgi:HEAT repeat protein